MRILVTGANGYLGQGVVTQLLDMGCEVIATDITTERIDSRAKAIAENLMTVEDPYTFYEKPDCVFHMAWRNGFVHNAESHISDLPAHYDFLKKMAESGVKRIAVMGSMHEIGFYEGAIDENTPCKPMSLYGISKNALRELTFLLCSQNQVIFQWLRGYYIVSSSTYGNSIFSKIASAAEEGKKEFPFTTGKNQYDFLDYDDFCYQAASAVNQDKINGIINICSGYPQTLANRVENYIKENNFPIVLKYGAFPDRAYDSKAVWGKNDKIMQIIDNREKSGCR